MQRRHLFEWNDQPWLPKSLRDTLTDYLQFVIQHAATYAPVVSLLRRAIAESGTHQIVDLCSGGAGPWPSIYAELTDISSIVLTDKFPNHVAFTNAQAISGGAIHFAAESVDATAVPQNRTGLRTLFSSFHHFHPTDARAILQDAVTKRQGIAIFEATHRSPLALSLMGIVPLMVLLVTPLIRPFRWSRLFWTYLIPCCAIPDTVRWHRVQPANLYSDRVTRLDRESCAFLFLSLGDRRTAGSPFAHSDYLPYWVSSCIAPF